MSVEMAIGSQRQPSMAPASKAASGRGQGANRATVARITRSEAAEYVAKYVQIRKLCAQRLREKYFSEQAPEGQLYYESEVQVGDVLVKESSEDPLVEFTRGSGPMEEQEEELQRTSSGSRLAPDLEMPLSMNRLKSQARKK